MLDYKQLRKDFKKVLADITPEEIKEWLEKYKNQLKEQNNESNIYPGTNCELSCETKEQKYTNGTT